MPDEIKDGQNFDANQAAPIAEGAPTIDDSEAKRAKITDKINQVKTALSNPEIARRFNPTDIQNILNATNAMLNNSRTDSDYNYFAANQQLDSLIERLLPTENIEQIPVEITDDNSINIAINNTRPQVDAKTPTDEEEPPTATPIALENANIENIAPIQTEISREEIPAIENEMTRQANSLKNLLGEATRMEERTIRDIEKKQAALEARANALAAEKLAWDEKMAKLEDDKNSFEEEKGSSLGKISKLKETTQNCIIDMAALLEEPDPKNPAPSQDNAN
ncbi:MAG: hypothetical protein WCO23_04510 [bacterium]